MINHPTLPLDSIAVIIADSGYVVPAFILTLSLKHFQPTQRIHILGISLSTEEKSLFEQFDNVFVFDATIARSDKPGAMRIIADILKGEALMTATGCDESWIALLDGDSLATGDLTPYLQPVKPGLYVRQRSPEEDNSIFHFFRKPGDANTGIPESFLNRWRADVGENDTPARTTTALSGNLVIHRDYLGFATVWKELMERVLSYTDPDSNDTAYYMPAEFALSALLLFAQAPPPVYDVLLASNPDAYLAHLGPAPQYWHIWHQRKLKYFDRVMSLLDEATAKGYTIPLLPFALKKRNKIVIAAFAYSYSIAETIWWRSKRLYKRIFTNAFQSQARRYSRKTDSGLSFNKRRSRHERKTGK